MFLILALWCINTLHLSTCNDPLQWSRYAQPSYHSIFSSDQNALSLFLTEAPIVRLKSSEHKLELFKNSQVIDISKIALSSHNLKRSVNLLRKNELTFKSLFHSTSDSSVEIMIRENIGFHSCASICQIKNAKMFSDILHLKDVISIFGDSPEIDISRLWIQSFQSERKASAYSAKYHIDISVNHSKVSILPENRVTSFGTVNCLAFHIKDWVADDCADIGAKTSYWQKMLGTSQYYPQQFFKLNVQLVLDDSFLINNQTGRTNVTSEFEWQLLHANWRVLIPVSRDIKLSSLQKATCICTRSKDILETRKLKARSAISEINLTNQKLFMGIEKQRIRSESSSDLSSVSVLLNDLQNIKARRPVKYFLDESMIYPLSINSSDSALLFHSKLNDTFGDFLSMVGYNRNKRALPGVILGSLKILSLGLPYLLEDSMSVMEDLISQFQAKVIVPQYSEKNQISSSAFAEILSSQFSEDIHFSVLNDRISVELENADFLLNISNGIDEKILAQYSASAEKLVYFQENILKILPQLLLRRLLPEIQHKLRPDGQILHHLTFSKSFIVCDFYWEQIVPHSKVTNYKFWALPAYQLEKRFETYDVRNLTISLDNKLALSAETNDIFQCQRRLITAVALPIESYCPRKGIEVMQAQVGLLWLNSSLVLIRGPSTVHYSCSEGTNKIIQLSKQFNLFVVHHVCTLHVQFMDGITFSIPMSQISPTQNFGLLHLLEYDITEATPKSQITQMWLISLTVCFILAFLVILLTIGYFCYYKTKIGVRIWRTLAGEESFPGETRIEFINRQNSQDRFSSIARNSSLSPPRQLPQQGGPRGEQILQEALNKQTSSRHDLQKPCDCGSVPQVTELGRFAEYPSMEYIFPNMRHDSGVTSGSYKSSLHLPLQKSSFDQEGRSTRLEFSTHSLVSMPSAPQAHFNV